EALFNANTKQTTIGGAINSVPQSTFEIDFYDTKSGKSSFVGSTNVITDATGNASFSKAINLVTGSADTISATATIILNAALAGEDYVAKTGFLTWPAGNTSAKTIAVTINGDTKVESDETFLLNLTNPSGVTLNNTSATGTIKNDDTSIKISDASITEGNT